METKDKKKEFLEGIEKKNVSNVVFKTEGLGALEFDLKMLTRTFKHTDVPFRIERISTDSYLKIANMKDPMESTAEILKKFIAYPVEAREIEFFNLDFSAMENVVSLITDFQNTPLPFLEHFKEN
ncbi:hypothetical protein [Fusobacterium necrophorum]|uniref:hypothetical protein n=1 Tax=Fusobacterium necrophorum TaxID=859 RepID=UPI00254F28C4|nr:hypothetical protein [Fusobacterium necrophorum]MDK4476185.1 hypothetical protein [Fusobacterium necrophorum]